MMLRQRIIAHRIGPFDRRSVGAPEAFRHPAFALQKKAVHQRIAVSRIVIVQPGDVAKKGLRPLSRLDSSFL